MALSFDPQLLPVLRVDDHLPAVRPEAMKPAALRRRFTTPPTWTPDIDIEPRVTQRLPTPASVLIALVVGEELRVLLTRRTDHLNDHPGQISFPGGRTEPSDADAVATALREAHEEIGLAPSFVELLGTMPEYTTGTGFVVKPVVALVKAGFSLRADPFEVADVFEVPLSFLMDPAHHRHHEIQVDGQRRRFLSMPWEAHDAQGQPQSYFIWGATAAMLRNLYRFLSA